MWSSAGLYGGTKATAEQASLDMGNSVIVLSALFLWGSLPFF